MSRTVYNNHSIAQTQQTLILISHQTLIYNTSSCPNFASLLASSLCISKKKKTCSGNLTFQIWFKSYGVLVKSHAIKSCNVQQMKHHSMNSLTFDLKVPKWDAYGYFLKPHRDNVLNITVFLLSDS